MTIKLTTLILLVVAFSVNSCTSNHTQSSEAASENSTDTLPDHQSRQDTLKEINARDQLNSADDSVTVLTFSKGVKSLSVKGHLDKPGDVVTYLLTVDKSTLLSGRLEVSKSPANIRFSQIVMPNGQSDGPFGRELDYKLPQKGVYKIKIAQNLMAENAFVGDFMMHLTCSEN